MYGITIPISDIDEKNYQSVFEHIPVEERIKQDRKKKLMFGKIKIIMRNYLSFSEQKMVETYFYHNHGVRDLCLFVVPPWVKDYDRRQSARYRVRKVLVLLSLLVQFFDENDYKKIFIEAVNILTKKQYIYLKAYLKYRSYKKCAVLFDCDRTAISLRTFAAEKKLNGNKVTKPLAQLVRGVRELQQGYHFR